MLEIIILFVGLIIIGHILGGSGSGGPAGREPGESSGGDPPIFDPNLTFRPRDFPGETRTGVSPLAGRLPVLGRSGPSPNPTRLHELPTLGEWKPQLPEPKTLTQEEVQELLKHLRKPAIPEPIVVPPIPVIGSGPAYPPEGVMPKLGITPSPIRVDPKPLEPAPPLIDSPHEWWGYPRVSEIDKLCWPNSDAAEAVLANFESSPEVRALMRITDSYVGSIGVNTSDDVLMTISECTGRSFEELVCDRMAMGLIKK